MSATPAGEVKRNLVVQRWGTPDVTIGSVNEAREMEEHGHRFNEKWIYRSSRTEAGPRERVIYWIRYDFVASYLIDATGGARREDPGALLAGLDDRLYHSQVERRPSLRR